MPRESFYNPDIIEGERPDFAYADAFAVEWAPFGGNYSLPGNPDSEAVLVLAGVYMDESAVRRLQAVLRRALRKGKGHHDDVHWALTPGDIVVQNPVNLEANLARLAQAPEATHPTRPLAPLAPPTNPGRGTQARPRTGEHACPR